MLTVVKSGTRKVTSAFISVASIAQYSTKWVHVNSSEVFS
jgi:hypothetical protein